MGFLRNYFSIAKQEANITAKVTKKYLQDKKNGKDAKFELEEPPWFLISLIVIIVIILLIIIF